MTLVKSNQIFVFGSNLLGRHGKGAAKRAFQQYGAEYGVAIGHMNRSYAIPTKDMDLKPLELFQIREFIAQFNAYAEANPDLEFYVTQVGCGLAKYRACDIAPMFAVLPNVWFDNAWKDHLVPKDVVHPINFFTGEL